MANNDYRNYGTLEPEYYSDNLGPITVKGKKQALVAGLESRLSINQSQLSELKNYQTSLAKMGKDLSKEDAARVQRLENIIANLKRIIDEQRTAFKLK